MYYSYIFIVLTLLTYPLFPDSFAELNLPLTKEMRENRANAKECKNPTKIKEEFTNSFQYGCFCGKDYPLIKHSSNKNYKDLNKTQREELINQYYKIKPYDSIDESCMKHDICYIHRGKEEQACNDAIYHDLKELKLIFKAREDSSYPKAKQCRVLSGDMASFFRTIFSTGEDISLIRYGMFAIITPITLGGKIIQKTPLILNNKGDYPKEGVKCLISSEKEK